MHPCQQGQGSDGNCAARLLWWTCGTSLWHGEKAELGQAAAGRRWWAGTEHPESPSCRLGGTSGSQHQDLPWAVSELAQDGARGQERGTARVTRAKVLCCGMLCAFLPRWWRLGHRCRRCQGPAFAWHLFALGTLFALRPLQCMALSGVGFFCNLLFLFTVFLTGRSKSPNYRSMAGSQQ